ncbi:MAG: glycosyltransferase [Acidobacteriota bacterium]
MAESMHVLHIYKDYPPVIGGIENHLRLLAERQADLGLEVTVLVTSRRRSTSKARENGVRVIRAGRLAEVSSTPLSLAICSQLRQLSADITHLHVPYPMGELAHWAFGQGRATVLTYHCDFTLQRFSGLLYRPFLRRLLRRADRIIATSLQYIDSSPLLRPLADKCSVVPLGTDLERWSRHTEVGVAAIRKRWSGPLVLFVGRLRHYKGLPYLIDAMQQVPATLIVVGTGPMRGALVRQAEASPATEKIHFLGHISDASLADTYAAAAVLVLPSSERSEAFGTVLLEAMASGTPVISTELSTGTSFVNRDGETGFVVPPRNSDALARAISKLVTDPQLQQEMGVRAQSRARLEFGVERMVEGVMEVYRAALGLE